MRSLGTPYSTERGGVELPWVCGRCTPCWTRIEEARDSRSRRRKMGKQDEGRWTGIRGLRERGSEGEREGGSRGKGAREKEAMGSRADRERGVGH